MKTVLALACSPRAGGNTDVLAETFSEGVRRSGGKPQILYLRNVLVRPCTGCGACARHPQHSCLLSDGDDAEKVFAAMLAASVVMVSAPVFFYALPAGLKSLIDRAQRFWVSGTKPSTGQLWAGLVGARPRGEKLFTGSELCLHYFGAALGLSFTERMLCYGYDAADALRQDEARLRAAIAWGEKAVKSAGDRICLHG